MIVVVELFRVGIEHQSFNAALLQSVATAFPDQRLEFWAESIHVERVSELIPLLPVEYRVIPVEPRHASLFKRSVTDSQIVRKAMLLAADNQNRVIFSSVTIPMLWALKIFGGKPAHQVAAVVHSGLTELRRSIRFNIVKRFLSLRRSLIKAPEFVTFWVLEQGIYEELARLAPQLARRVAVLLHPLPPDLDGIDHQAPLQPLRIGLLGLATPQKGLMHFLRLAKAFSGREIIFELVGRVHQNYRQQLAGELRYLDRLPPVEPMPRSDFVARIKGLSYVAFFFEGNHYSLTASGVLLDCIALGIPLIGQKHPHFEILQAKVGEIGFFCDPGDEVNMIEELLSNLDGDRYLAQCQAMRQLSRDRTALILAEQIKAALYLRE